MHAINIQIVPAWIKDAGFSKEVSYANTMHLTFRFDNTNGISSQQ
jgi:hypothetical protein